MGYDRSLLSPDVVPLALFKLLISARKEELKAHVVRIQRHEAEILNKMKIMLEQVNITKDQADLIVTRLKNLDNPQTSKYIPKFVAARKEKDLIKVKEEIDEELDAIKNLLQDNHNKFMKVGIYSAKFPSCKQL